MPKEYKVYLNDILECIEKIEKYTKGVSYEKFAKSTLLADAVIRNLEVIGEAVKKIPADVKRKYSGIEWKKISGLRDVLIHEYFGINLEIVWDIIVNKIPELKFSVMKISEAIK